MRFFKKGPDFSFVRTCFNYHIHTEHQPHWPSYKMKSDEPKKSLTDIFQFFSCYNNQINDLNTEKTSVENKILALQQQLRSAEKTKKYLQEESRFMFSALFAHFETKWELLDQKLDQYPQFARQLEHLHEHALQSALTQKTLVEKKKSLRAFFHESQKFLHACKTQKELQKSAEELLTITTLLHENLDESAPSEAATSARNSPSPR